MRMSGRFRSRAGPAFPKNVLANGLREAGIGYIHLKALGTPPEGREAARKHDRARVCARLCRTARTARSAGADRPTSQPRGMVRDIGAVLRARAERLPPIAARRRSVTRAEGPNFVCGCRFFRLPTETVNDRRRVASCRSVSMIGRPTDRLEPYISLSFTVVGG